MSARGFTLLELVIALALLAVMMPLLYNGLRLGTKTWDALEARTRAARDLDLLEVFLRRQIEQAQPLLFKDEQGERRLPFFGERQALRFVTPLPAPLGGGGLYWFTLGIDDGRLVLRYELFQRAEWQRYGAPPAQSALLARGLSDAQFEYLGNQTATWASRWDEKHELPRMIRLRLRTEREWRELVIAPRLTPPQARPI